MRDAFEDKFKQRDSNKGFVYKTRICKTAPDGVVQIITWNNRKSFLYTDLTQAGNL